MAAGVVSVPKPEVPGRAKYCEYAQPSKPELCSFVARAKDGSCRAVVDSREKCHESKKGYHQDDQEMVCNERGKKFSLGRPDAAWGDCNPARLPFKNTDDRLLVDPAVLKKASRFVGSDR